MELTTVLQLIETGGLIFVIFLFVNNKVVTTAQSNKTLEHSKEIAEKTAEIIGIKITEGIEEAIQRGITEGLKSLEKEAK